MNTMRHTSLPKNMEMKRRFDHLLITRKWLKMRSAAIILFTIGWDYYLIDMLISFNNAKSVDAGAVKIVAILSLLGVVLTYFSMAEIFNKTHIFISREYLKISHTPLPWFGCKQVNAKDFKQLFVFENPAKYNSNGGSHPPTYVLRAITKQGKNLRLLSNIDKEQALFLEEQIEGYLNITDKPIKTHNEVR